jgi:serine/threonine-protein kinase
MDPSAWNRIQALFHQALDLPADERLAWLEAHAAGEPELLREVRELLAADGRGAPLLDRGLAEVSNEVLGDGAAELPRHRFGPYRIRRVLGEGGMGVVYLAEREDLESFAAVKILRDATLSPSRRERFASEQRALARLNHPSIARLYDAGALPDGTPWIVMEYVDGMPLAAYCAARVRTVAGRLELFRAVCEAVQHAHQHAIIHRDLKPSNILVTHEGRVKLLDFGIAKQLEGLDLPADQTRTGLRLMTPAYAAPEQLSGEQVGTHTDIYSLGVILYELLTGRLPFDFTNRSPAEIATLLEREPEPPSAVARQPVGPLVTAASWSDLDVLCLTAMHKDPARRYRTVDALIGDLDRFRRGEPLAARPDTLGYRLAKFTRRNARAVTVAAAGVVLVIGLVAFYTIRLASARTAALAEAARTQRIQGFMLDLFQGGDESVGPAESLRVVTLLDRGVEEARSLDGEPRAQADLYHTLGGIYQKLGEFGRADSLFQLALDRRRALLGDNHPDVATSLVGLALLRVDQARLPEAERLAQDGLALTRQVLPGTHLAVARATKALGRVRTEQGDYPEAIELLEEAVALYAAPGHPPADLLSSLHELANAHFYHGSHAVADSINRRALAMSRELYGERDPRVAEELNNLGSIQQELGYYPEAERYYREALEITRGFYGDEHHLTATNLTMLGRTLVFQNRYAEAESLLTSALAVQERVFGPLHQRVASTVGELAGIAYMQDRPDDAEPRYRRVIDIYRVVYGERHQVMGTAIANLAGVYVDRKQYREAERLYRQALGIYQGALAPDHVNLGIIRLKLGRSLLRQGRFAEAERESRAGYEILIKQSAPSTSFLKAARRDLVVAYDSLGRREEAARFRGELGE